MGIQRPRASHTPRAHSAEQNRRSIGRSLRTGVAPPETSRTRVVLSRRELRRSTSDRLRCVRGPVPDGSACDQGHFHDAAFPRCRYFRAYTDPKGAAFARAWAELRAGRVRDFYVRVRNDGNTVGAFTVRGSALMRGSVVRYYSAGVEITNAMRSASGWHPILAPGPMRQLRAQVTIGSWATIGSLKSAKVTATWQGREPDAVKGVVRVVVRSGGTAAGAASRRRGSSAPARE